MVPDNDDDDGQNIDYIHHNLSLTEKNDREDVPAVGEVRLS